MSNQEFLDLSGLPAPVANYLRAHVERDYATSVTFLREDAEVFDDGKTFKGRDNVREWFGRVASEYEYTTTLTSAAA